MANIGDTDFNFNEGKQAGIKEKVSISSNNIGNLDDMFEDNKIATSGNPGHGASVITPEIKAEARKRAESPKGLHIPSFQKEFNITVMNVDELLKR